MDCVCSDRKIRNCEAQLVIASVKFQEWDKTYEPCKALMRGTMFAALDKPFKGGCR